MHELLLQSESVYMLAIWLVCLLTPYHPFLLLLPPLRWRQTREAAGMPKPWKALIATRASAAAVQHNTASHFLAP